MVFGGNVIMKTNQYA